jgi:hypothetical protein
MLRHPVAYQAAIDEITLCLAQQPAGQPIWSGYRRTTVLDISYPPWWIRVGSVTDPHLAKRCPDHETVTEFDIACAIRFGNDLYLRTDADPGFVTVTRRVEIQ